MPFAATVLLYASVWLAVILFVAGEAGKRTVLQTGITPRWAWTAWMSGALLCAGHTVLALAIRHHWSVDEAMRATAERTQSVFGIYWTGGLYLNCVFVVAWLAEAIWWRANPRGYFGRPTLVTMILRGFYAVILANAAIIFASPVRRLGGLLLMGILLWTWRPTAHGQSAARSQRHVAG